MCILAGKTDERNPKRRMQAMNEDHSASRNQSPYLVPGSVRDELEAHLEEIRMILEREIPASNKVKSIRDTFLKREG